MQNIWGLWCQLYILIQYSVNYQKPCGGLWQCCRNKSALNNGFTCEFDSNNVTTDSFKCKETIKRQ